MDPLDSAAQAAKAVGLFETTVVTATMPDAEDLNRRLTSVVRSRMEQDQGVKRSNVNGWQSPPDMLSACSTRAVSSHVAANRRSASTFAPRFRGLTCKAAVTWAIM